MVKTAKKKAPSRVKYEQGHPTVSCRVPKEIYEKLQTVKGRESKSFADILKVGLGILEVQAKKEDNKKNAYKKSYRKGYAEAERQYKITYPCSVCGKTVQLSSKEAKQAASEYMQKHGWGHGACHEREQ